MSIAEAVGLDTDEVLLRVEHMIIADVRELNPSDDRADATREAAIHAVSLIREAFDNAHQRLGSASNLDTPLLCEAA